MHAKKLLLAVAVTFSLLTATTGALAASQAADYYCDSGAALYRSGKYDEALQEFHKVLIIEPEHQVAKQYINSIFQKETPAEYLVKLESSYQEKAAGRQLLSREEIINNALADFERPSVFSDKPEESPPEKKKPVELSGEYRLSLGVTPHDVIWKDTNADRIGVPHEKNWRYLWGTQRENTYDPKIYDRLNLNIDTNFDNPLNGFMQITIDPWTFVGRNTVTVTSLTGNDAVLMNLKYWSGDKQTINETYRSNKGNIINLNQVKVEDGKTTASRPKGITSWNTTFNQIEPMDLKRDYKPVRKFWLDYQEGDYTFKLFPLSDEFEALTSDDPLRLSNNHAYWEESPWLDQYEPSRTFDNTGEPVKAGKWVRALSYISRDSSDDYPHRMIFLRGANLKIDTGAYEFEATVATPMSLWDKYTYANSIDAAARLKVPISDNFLTGLTATGKMGLKKGNREALNAVSAMDLNYLWMEDATAYGELAESHTEVKEAKGFSSNYDGVAARVGLKYDTTKDKAKEIDGMYKADLYVAHLDRNFYPALSNYRYTRGDSQPYSRHIYFSPIKDQDKALLWGDGIERARNTAGLNLNLRSLESKIDTAINYRHVLKDSGKYVESAVRLESTYQPVSRLTTKILGYYLHLPRTHANYDPLLYAKTMYSLTDHFSDDDSHPENIFVVDDKDPSVGAFGLGAKYELIEKVLAVEGVYETTNDPLDFPRGLLNDVYVDSESRQGVLWDKVVPFLYDQSFFDMPPYDYYSIAKVKTIFTPFETWKFILSYTYNENKYASGLDDNINHLGLESEYKPGDKLSFWLKYIYSKLYDVYMQNKTKSHEYYEGHHNVFFGSEYKFNKNESFTFLYGEFVGYNDPYEESTWSLSTVDTQHIFRLLYRKKF